VAKPSPHGNVFSPLVLPIPRHSFEARLHKDQKRKFALCNFQRNSSFRPTAPCPSLLRGTLDGPLLPPSSSSSRCRRPGKRATRRAKLRTEVRRERRRPLLVVALRRRVDFKC